MNELVTFTEMESPSKFRMLLNFSKKLFSARFAVKNVYLKRRKDDGAVTLLMFFIRFFLEKHQ